MSMIMKKSTRPITVLGLIVAGAVCAAGAPVNLQRIMVSNVNPSGLALWDVTNNAMDDSGKVSAKKLTEENWKKLLEMGTQLEEGGRALATSEKVIAASPGSKLQDEANPGASTAQDVQRLIDARPAEFRRHALALQKTGADIVTAVKKHDAKRLDALSGSLDAVCEACHTGFWYPQLKK